MREGTAPVVRREDYTAPAYWIRQADLAFDLDPPRPSSPAAADRAQHRDRHRARRCELHGDGLNLLRVLANGESVSFRHEDGKLVIDHPPADDRFTLEIRNTCAPEKNTELSGLYTSSGGFFTQCEAEGFRRITYFLDRPDVMAVYTVTLRADKARYPVLLSNGNRSNTVTSTAGATSPSGTTPSPSPATCSRWWPADLVCREQRITRARAKTTCCRSTCAAATSTRPNTR
jgi:aminopeptidase N